MQKVRCLFNTRKKVVLSHSDSGGYRVCMEAITEEAERKIDKQNDTLLSFSYKTLSNRVITNSTTYLYGEINLNDKKDIDYLLKFKHAILNPYDYHNWYYTSFDFKTGEITYNDDHRAFLGINFLTDTVAWFKFKYCILGKPKRVIIYKEPCPKRLE